MNRHSFPLVFFVSTFLTLGSSWAQEPILLFDGSSLAGWTRMDGKPVADDWEAVDGTLHLSNKPSGGANLFSERDFTDFDLEFEWKIGKEGNNGLKYRVRKYGKQYLGIEYQILDDAANDLHPRGLTGSLYELYEPNSAKQLKPVGEFNHSRVIVRGNHIEHWLNGQLIASADVGSSEWFQRVSESKFAEVAGFGQNRTGKIMLTAHGSEVWYRNIILTPLPPPVATYAYSRSVSRSHRLFGLRTRGHCRFQPLSRLRNARTR